PNRAAMRWRGWLGSSPLPCSSLLVSIRILSAASASCRFLCLTQAGVVLYPHPFASLRPSRVIDHKQPRPIRLAPHHLYRSPPHRQGLTVSVNARSVELRAWQREVSVSTGDSLDLRCIFELEGQSALEGLANSSPASGDLARVKKDKTGIRLIQSNHGFQVAFV